MTYLLTYLRNNTFGAQASCFYGIMFLCGHMSFLICWLCLTVFRHRAVLLFSVLSVYPLSIVSPLTKAPVLCQSGTKSVTISLLKCYSLIYTVIFDRYCFTGRKIKTQRIF